jgi:hypothetical protein
LVDSCHATVFGNSSGKTALKAIYTAFVVAKPCFSAESGDPNAARPWKLGVFCDSHQPEAIAAPPAALAQQQIRVGHRCVTTG